jgi:isoquinoline 1-oxidoreductase alpha subunit
MAVVNLNVNEKKETVDIDPKTPLLWVLREHLKLVGTKYGCGIAQCSAQKIHFFGISF